MIGKELLGFFHTFILFQLSALLNSTTNAESNSQTKAANILYK